MTPEAALQALAEQAQELDMGYGPTPITHRVSKPAKNPGYLLVWVEKGESVHIWKEQAAITKQRRLQKSCQKKNH